MRLLPLVFYFAFFSALAQLTPDFHRQRREELRKLLPENSVAIFFANPVHNRSNDVDYEYHQDPNFYYLTGHKASNAVLFVFKENQKIDSVITNELMAVQARNPLKEVWNGPVLGIDEAQKILGLKHSMEGCDLKDNQLNLKNIKEVLYYNLPESNNPQLYDCYELEYMAAVIKEKAGIKAPTDPELQGMNYSPGLKILMATLRQNKKKEELSLLRKAISITCEGIKEVMRVTKPGDAEYTAESTAEYVFKKSGAEDLGYPSIAGGGGNSCILHYITNRNTLKDGDMLVADMGAEYNGYTADVTRTMPVNGKFNEQQKIIYNIVLEAQVAGIKVARKDSSFRVAHNEAVRVIKKRLLEHGIIKDEEEYRTYFFHGTSHYLGLDVHDAGTFETLKPGQVITVEPGIYIKEGSACDKKWWNIGVRIEDDILITSGEAEVLSACVPKTVDEIEKLMAEEPIFVK